jgi:hypothetical protein
VSKEWPINIRLTVTEDDRRAVAHYYGEKGMATLDHCRRLLRLEAEGTLDSLQYDLAEAQKRAEAERIEGKARGHLE